MALQGPTPAGDGGVVPLRIERGAEVFATDGALGTVEQVIMNQQTHELHAIVVQPIGSTRELVIGVAHVARAGENQVHLDFSKTQMGANPTLAQPYNPAAYVPVTPDASMSREQAARIAERVDQPVVTGLEPDAVEVMAHADQIRPETPVPAPPPTPPERLTADWRVPGNIASVAPRPLEPPAGREAQQKMETSTMTNTNRATGKTPGKMTSDRALETTQAPSAQQEAQQIAYNPDSAAYLSSTPTTTATNPSAGLPGWVLPAAVGVGAAAVIAGTTFGVLAWRRASQPTGLDWWRAQIRQVAREPQKTSRQLTRSLQRSALQTAKSAQKTINQVQPELATIATLAGDQADAWRSMLGEQLGAWRDSVGGPAMKNAKQISKRVSKNLPKGLAGWAAALASVAVLASKQLEGWRDALGNQLDDWRDSVSNAIDGNSKSLSKTLTRSAKRISRGPRRAVTRAVLSMRWFRRGIFLGAVGGAVLGLFFAPVPGSQLRLQVWNFIQQLRGQLQSTVATAQAKLPQRAMSAAGTTGALPGATGTAPTSKATKPTSTTPLSETGMPR